MDVSVKSSEKKSIVVAPFDKNEATEFLLSVSNISDGLILSENNNEKYGDSKIYSCTSGSEDQKSNTGHIICENRYIETTSETTNCSEIFINETDVTKQLPTVCSWTILHTLEANQSTEDSREDIENRGTNVGSILDVTEKVNKVAITCSETNEGLTIRTKTTDGLLITCTAKTETPSNGFSDDMCPSNIMKSENIVINTETNKFFQIFYKIEKFFDAINSTNKDMQKKSGILLQKQNLVDEILSYIHAVQSIIRLSTSRGSLSKIIPKYNASVYPNKPFYEAGDLILEELRLYKSELQADYKVWETYRKEIQEISGEMLYDFEYCEDEMSAKVLMHEISMKICEILKRMEMVTSKREDTNENCIDLMDSVDTYITYSSAFIIGD